MSLPSGVASAPAGITNGSPAQLATDSAASSSISTTSTDASSSASADIASSSAPAQSESTSSSSSSTSTPSFTSSSTTSTSSSIFSTSVPATPSTTASGSTPPTEPSSSSQAPTPTPTLGGTTTGSGTGTQTTLTSTKFVSASDAPGLNVNSLKSPDTPFFQNKAAVAGVFTAVGVVIAILLVCLIAWFVRRRRQRQHDREMDEVSFVPASHRTIDDDGDGSRRVPSLDRSLSTSSHGAYSGYSGGSYGGYARPPLSVQQQQHYYNYGPTPPEQYAPSEYMYSNTGAGAVSAVRRAPPGQIGESPIVQPPRARVARAQSTYSNSGLAHRPSQTATVQLTDPSPPPARDYLSNYTSPPTSGESVSLGPTTDIPLSPPLPNPYGGEEESHRRVLKVANE